MKKFLTIVAILLTSCNIAHAGASIDEIMARPSASGGPTTMIAASMLGHSKHCTSKPRTEAFKVARAKRLATSLSVLKNHYIREDEVREAALSEATEAIEAHIAIHGSGEWCWLWTEIITKDERGDIE